MDPPSVESLALRGEWRSVLNGVGLASTSSAPTETAWRVVALMKLRQYPVAEAELDRLDLDDENLPFALRWCAADLPSRVGRPTDAAAAFARLVCYCDARRKKRAEREGEEDERATAKTKEKKKSNDSVWRERAESACWAAASIAARSEDPRAARAWARAALERRAERRRRSPLGSSSPSKATATTTTGDEASWEPPLAAGPEALSAAARLELALGEPAEARRLFAAAAAARAKEEATGPSTTTTSSAEDARASATLRLSQGDASRAASGFRASSSTPTPEDLNNEALCLLHAGEVSGARSVALESLLLVPAEAPSSSSSSSRPAPLLFSEAALRTAAALADLAPPAAARAARDALFDAVQAAGAPEDLDASFLAAA